MTIGSFQSQFIPLRLTCRVRVMTDFLFVVPAMNSMPDDLIHLMIMHSRYVLNAHLRQRSRKDSASCCSGGPAKQVMNIPLEYPDGLNPRLVKLTVSKIH